MIAQQHSVSNAGRWGFFIALSLIFSISVSYRVTIFGLLVHPYLLILPLPLIFSRVNLFSVPRNVFQPMIVFVVIFTLASLRNSNPLSEPFKAVASLATFLLFAQCVKNEKDFRTISWGFIFCALAIAVRSLLISESESVSRFSGINALEGLGNKNAQSLFTLPAIFVGLILSLKYSAERKLIRLAFLGVLMFFIVVSIFLSANRSGWVGLAVIFVVFILYSGIHIRSIILTLVAGFLVYIAITNFASDIFAHKQEQTLKGYSSDVGRQMLATQAFEVGMENALFGVGMDELHRQMALRVVGQRIQQMDTHILWGYLFGATGIFSLISFLLFLYALTYRFYKHIQLKNGLKSIIKTRYLIIGFVLLFSIRACFTREILYSPSFMGVMGLLFGYYMMQIRNAQSISRA